MHLVAVLLNQLTVTIWMDLVLHMGPPANTSGALLVVLMKIPLIILLPHARVAGSTTRNRIPSFVGQNYFCESGLTQYSDGINGPLFSNGDPLWDGQGCGPTSSCCTFNSPPWFNVRLSSPTTDDIEVRICGDEGIGNEDTPVQLIELYVK